LRGSKSLIESGEFHDAGGALGIHRADAVEVLDHQL
jgi:hypothetical protein